MVVQVWRSPGTWTTTTLRQLPMIAASRVPPPDVPL